MCGAINHLCSLPPTNSLFSQLQADVERQQQEQDAARQSNSRFVITNAHTCDLPAHRQVVYRKKRLVGGRSKKARKVVEAVAALQAGLEDAFAEFVPKSMVSHCGATTCPRSTHSVHSGTTRHWQCSLF